MEIDRIPGIVFGELPPTIREKRTLETIASIAQKAEAIVLNPDREVTWDMLRGARFAIIDLTNPTLRTVLCIGGVLGRRIPAFVVMDAQSVGRNILPLRDLEVTPYLYDHPAGLRTGAETFLQRARSHTFELENEHDRRKVITVGDLVIDLNSHQVTLGGESVKFTPHEFKLLVALALHFDRIVPNKVLINLGGWSHKDPSVLKTHISHIRKKVNYTGENGRPGVEIVNLSSVGYRLTLARYPQEPIGTA